MVKVWPLCERRWRSGRPLVWKGMLVGAAVVDIDLAATALHFISASLHCVPDSKLKMTRNGSFGVPLSKRNLATWLCCCPVQPRLRTKASYRACVMVRKLLKSGREFTVVSCGVCFVRDMSENDFSAVQCIRN